MTELRLEGIVPVLPTPFLPEELQHLHPLGESTLYIMQRVGYMKHQ